MLCPFKNLLGGPKRTKIQRLYAAGALLAFSTVPANAASFTGQQIKTTWRLPTETTAFALSVSPSSVFVAGNGVEAEAQLNAVRFLTDFGENDITFIFLHRRHLFYQQLQRHLLRRC